MMRTHATAGNRQFVSGIEKSVKLRWDRDYLFVESNGVPDHAMMVGIRSWQQQVPLPQNYTGTNAWQIPLHPVPAKKPASTKGRFLRGAIALAVNGIPIFNPLNNRGDDAYLVGELTSLGVIVVALTITTTILPPSIWRKLSALDNPLLMRWMAILFLVIKMPTPLITHHWMP